MTKQSAILVVGGAGYIGSQVVKDVLEAGHQVIVLDNFSRGHRDLVAGVEVVEGSLGDPAVLERVFSGYLIGAVMHFAAFSLVGESVKSPLDYFDNNVRATIVLLQAMVMHKIKRFIFSSSAAVYGEAKEMPITEDHPCDPTNPYGQTKVMVERILESCDAAYGLKYVALRYFNAAGADVSGRIGERHEPESHLIPLILKVATGERKDIKIFGTDYPTPDGTCVRDYIHVSDLSQAHLLALQQLLDEKRSWVFNLGNSKGYSVRDVIRTAGEVTGRSVKVIETERRPGDPPVLIASAEKIKRHLGWKPRFEDLRTIVETAWAWEMGEWARKRGEKTERCHSVLQ